MANSHATQPHDPRAERPAGSSPFERSHESKLGFLPGDGGAQIGLKVLEIVLDYCFSAPVRATASGHLSWIRLWCAEQHFRLCWGELSIIGTHPQSLICMG